MTEKTQRLYEEVADRLLERIRSGELQPGDRIPSERALAKEYSVSRSVIREAIRSMERMGCVESYVGGGTYVKAPDLLNVVDPLTLLISQKAESAMELTEARLLLEPEIVRLAARRRTKKQLEEMKRTLEEARQDVRNGGVGLEQDSRFHEELAHASGNPVLEMMFSTCIELTNRSREVTQSMIGVPERALVDHENILEAISAQNEKSAERYMRNHLYSTHENLRKAKAKDAEQETEQFE